MVSLRAGRGIPGGTPPYARPVMLAGIPVDAATTAELTTMVRAAGADELPERLEQALDDGVALLALTI